MTVEEDSPGALVLTGPANLYAAEGLLEALRAAVAGGTDLRIDLGGAGPWDVAGLQLLVAAVASGRKAGRSVRLVKVPGVCTEIAERSGLSGWLSGVADSFQ